MNATKHAVSMALLDWMKSRDKTDAVAAEEFAAAAVAGVKKITLGFGDLQSGLSEAPKVEPQD